MMRVKQKVRRSLMSACGSLLVLVMSAQVALAGSGTGLIQLPNPEAVLVPGLTETSFRNLNCAKEPENQGLDAWIVPLAKEDAYLVVKALNLPASTVGYTFYVGFYSVEEGKCDWHRGVSAVGNPTQSLKTYGQEWAVISVSAGVEVQISWRGCATSACSI